MKLVTAVSMAALVFTSAVGLAQAPANNAGDTKNQPGLVEKAIGTITGRSPGTKEGADVKSEGSAARAAGDTNYPDQGAVKKTGK